MSNTFDCALENVTYRHQHNMKLQNGANAYVPLTKLLNYLLSETHPIGKSKAKFFRSVGFNETNANLLKEGLQCIAQSEDIKEAIPTLHGVKYIIDGMIQTPVGISIKVRTLWIVDRDDGYPRFVTAYPI